MQGVGSKQSRQQCKGPEPGCCWEVLKESGLGVWRISEGRLVNRWLLVERQLVRGSMCKD